MGLSHGCEVQGDRVGDAQDVAAFLNSRYGATLVIGIGDQRAFVGLEHDHATLRKEGKVDADLFQLHLNQLIENSVGIAAAVNVTTEVLSVSGGDVCRVHVDPCGFPVTAGVTFETKAGLAKKTSFFVRLNNGTRSIDDEVEREKYIATRWSSTDSSREIAAMRGALRPQALDAASYSDVR